MIKKITGTEYIDETDSQRRINLSLWQSLIIMLIAIVVLVSGYLDLKGNINVIMKMPPTKTIGAQHIVYNLNGANVTYYELWGRYLIEEAANFDANNVSEKMKIIYGEMRPTDAVRRIDSIEKFSQDIVLNKISQEFTLLEVDVNIPKDKLASEAIVTIKGISKSKLSNAAQEPKECEYSVLLNFNEGVFYVKDFGTTCF